MQQVLCKQSFMTWIPYKPTAVDETRISHISLQNKYKIGIKYP